MNENKSTACTPVISSCQKNEELKSCIYRVEIANAGMVVYWLWHHLLVLLLEETVPFTTQTAKNNL